MTVLANFYRNINIHIYDKFKSLVEKWRQAGHSLVNNTDKRDIKLPIVEKSLQELYAKVFNKNLLLTDEIKNEDLSTYDVIYICVNTPSTTNYKIKTDHSIDELQKEINRGIQLSLENVYSSIEGICEKILESKDVNCIFRERIIIQKSTVPIETLKGIKMLIKTFYKKNLDKLNVILKNSGSVLIETDDELNNFVSRYYKLVNIPEFLAEGI